MDLTQIRKANISYIQKSMIYSLIFLFSFTFSLYVYFEFFCIFTVLEKELKIPRVLKYISNMEDKKLWQIGGDVGLSPWLMLLSSCLIQCIQDSFSSFLSWLDDVEIYILFFRKYKICISQELLVGFQEPELSRWKNTQDYFLLILGTSKKAFNNKKRRRKTFTAKQMQKSSQYELAFTTFGSRTKSRML